MGDLFSICIRKKEDKYRWNIWRILTDFKLLLEESYKIQKNILERIEDRHNKAICILSKSGLPLIPIPLMLNLPFFLYKRQHFIIGSSAGTTSLLPFEHKSYLHGKEIFILDTEVCTGRLMDAAKCHFHRHSAKFIKMYALMSYSGIKSIKKNLLWRRRAKQIEHIYSIEENEKDILKSMNADVNDKKSRDLIRESSFWGLDNEPIYNDNLYIPQSEISKEDYENLIILCSDSHIQTELSNKVLLNDYINLEWLFIYPSLFMEVAESIIKNISIFDYDVICGLSDVGMAFALALAIAAKRKEIFSGQLAYLGRTSGRYGKLVWPDTLDLRNKKVLLVDNKIRSGDVCAFSYLYLKNKEGISHCDISVIMEYGDLEDKKYYWFFLKEGIKIFTVFRHDSKTYKEGKKKIVT